MKIAILGWGSLIWAKDRLTLGSDKVAKGNLALATDWVLEDNLALTNGWAQGGPKLPIEFSRVSSTRDGALTLVIDLKNGEENPTSFAVSRYMKYDEAIRNLAKREGTIMSRTPYWHIGFIICGSNESHSREPGTASSIRDWANGQAKKYNFDAVIWTDLPPNFEDESRTHKARYLHKNCAKSLNVDVPNMKFTPAIALAYLHCLKEPGATKACEYLHNTPSQVETPVRRLVRNDLQLSKCQ